jgi:hypothetical protein
MNSLISISVKSSGNIMFFSISSADDGTIVPLQLGLQSLISEDRLHHTHVRMGFGSGDFTECTLLPLGTHHMWS